MQCSSVLHLKRPRVVFYHLITRGQDLGGSRRQLLIPLRDSAQPTNTLLMTNRLMLQMASIHSCSHDTASDGSHGERGERKECRVAPLGALKSQAGLLQV